MAKLKKQRKNPLEADEQIPLVDLMTRSGIDFYHIPNGTMLPDFIKFPYIAKLKKLGLQPGVPDLCILTVPPHQVDYMNGKNLAWYNCRGVYIEMKSKTGKASDNQNAFGEKLKKNGYFFAVCRGFDEAKELLTAMGYFG